MIGGYRPLSVRREKTTNVVGGKRVYINQFIHFSPQDIVRLFFSLLKHFSIRTPPPPSCFVFFASCCKNYPYFSPQNGFRFVFSPLRLTACGLLVGWLSCTVFLVWCGRKVGVIGVGFEGKGFISDRGVSACSFCLSEVWFSSHESKF